MTYAQAIGHVDAIGEAIIQWARPKGGKWQTSPLALHPLADFRSAAAIAVGYLLFVLVFSALMCLVRGPIKNLYGLKFLYNIIQVRPPLSPLSLLTLSSLSLSPRCPPSMFSSPLLSPLSPKSTNPTALHPSTTPHLHPFIYIPSSTTPQSPPQVMLCSYMCIEAGVQAWRHSYTLLPCQPFNHAAPVMGDILYIFYLSKVCVCGGKGGGGCVGV